jgi:tRNA-modifying protein YgfZ
MKIFRPNEENYARARRGTAFIRLGRGVLRGVGADRLDLLHRISTNATRDLTAGRETTTILTSDKGRIMEVVRVLAFEDHILMILSGDDTEMVRAWLDKYTIMDDFTVTDVTAEWALVGVHGEQARAAVRESTGTNPPDAGSMAIAESGDVIVLRDARISGPGGFLIVASPAAAESVIERLEAIGVFELDRETYETLRIEAGQPEMGRELDEQYNPLEAGIVQLVSFTKGCYIGQEVIARLDTYDKVQRHLVGFVLDSAATSENDSELTLREEPAGTKLGVVTSLAYSPTLGRTIGLGYVRTQHAVPGNELAIVADGEKPDVVAKATLTKLPFDV